MRILAWSHNIDQEYRKGMSNIDKIRACHKLFMEDNMNRSKELKYKCCEELDLPHSRTKRDSLSKHDHLFQIAFRTGEIWDLQDKIFDMWLKFETIGQKKYISPVKPKNAKNTVTDRPGSMSTFPVFRNLKKFLRHENFDAKSPKRTKKPFQLFPM